MKGREEMGKRFMQRRARKKLEGMGLVRMRRSGGEVDDEAEWR
jgi:hypothetical protein